MGCGGRTEEHIMKTSLAQLVDRHLSRTVVLFAFGAVACTATGCSGGSDESASSTSSSADSLASIANLALANVGKGACSENSLGGRDFDSSCTGNGGYPEFWCADFARWVWQQQGAANTSELTAAAGSFYTYGQRHGTLHSTPAVGDAVVFDYKGGGYADHVAIVSAVYANGSIETVSGDWNGASGSEATFSGSSHVVLNAPAYNSTVGTYPGIMGMTISGYVAPAGLSVSAMGDPVIAPPPPPYYRGMARDETGKGYWLVGIDGGVFAFGDAGFYGSMGGKQINASVVGMAGTPDGKGYWIVGADGGIYSFGDAGFYGSMGGKTLNAPVVGMASTPSGQGYWLVASDGGLFSFGDAGFYGSMGGKTLNAPVVGMTATPNGQGYWLVASDGGLFAFGDAGFYGSMGGKTLNAPVVGMSASADGKGYWLVAADGGLFSFGDAPFEGSMGGKPLNKPVTGIASTPDGNGYWLLGGDGGLFSFGDAGFYGSRG
jgi:hypothetical protein